MTWRAFEKDAPELAQLGRGRFEATGVALVGTVRRDGSPRISPVEPYLVVGHLLVGMLERSHKALDLLRDPRCTVHSSVSEANGMEGESKLLGRAVLLTDPSLAPGDYEAWWTAESPPDARISIEIVRGTANSA